MNAPTLIVHIVGGSLALLSGAAALSLRKGGRLHGQAGTLFFAAMAILTCTGSAMAAINVERGTVLIGLLTLYLVVTSWASARRRSGIAGKFELAAFAFSSACALTFLAMGRYAAGQPNGQLDSLPASVHYAFGAIAALAAALDLNFVLRRRIALRQRIARHLWRMCTALLIAAFSFFLGQQKVMPEAMRGSPWLFVPEIAVILAMIFWLARTRFSARFGGLRPSLAPEARPLPGAAR